MAPTPEEALPERPCLLNEKFKVLSYDGGAFKNKAQYDVKNVLIPIIEPFHCSGSGTKFNLVLRCSEDFTLTHFYVSAPGPRCTEPIKSGLVWVTDQVPDVEKLKKYDSMCSEELMEIVKGLRTYSSSEEAGSVPDPCLYFTTDQTSRETEVELPKWREGKFVVVKFLDTHKDQGNIDVGIVGLIGYFGRHAKQHVSLGPWMHRTGRQPWVHPNELKSMFSSSGWVCDGRDFTGGCRSGQTDFHQTNVYTVTFRCTTSGFDLCEKCTYDPTLGRVADESIQNDLEALADTSLCKLAATRLRHLWRRNWVESLPRYFDAGLLDTLVQALQKCIENSQRPEEERATAQRQQPGAETQKRQTRRALLQLTTELAQRLLGLGSGGETSTNDLVWAFRVEPEGQEQWDEGRVVQLPKSLGDSLNTKPSPPPKNALSTALGEAAEGSAPSGEGSSDAAGAGSEAAPAAVAPDAAKEESGTAAPEAAAVAAPSEEASAGTSKDSKAQEGCYLVSWRDGQAPSWVSAEHTWRMTADEDVMMATASLFLEVSNGPTADIAKLKKLLQQGADLMAVNGQGCTALLIAVRAQASVETLSTLLEAGACPDAAGREGVTPLELVMRMQTEGKGDAEWLSQCAELLKKHGALCMSTQAKHEETIRWLCETFGLKMVGALLTLQSPMSLPPEILEVLHLLFQKLPVSVINESLEPQAFRALTSLLQHLVGGTDNLGVALVGCRIMRALYSQPDARLRNLVRSHGAHRWAQRLSAGKDIAQCGIYRQAHHEKVTVDDLSKEAQALSQDLAKLQDGESMDFDSEWRSNEKLAEVVEALQNAFEPMPGRLAPVEGLFALRELLKKTEKGSITDERCAAFELEKAEVPREMLRYLKVDGASATSLQPGQMAQENSDGWKLFHEAFGDHSKQSRKGLARLMKALHAVVETAEAYPIWRHKKERGLKALTEPISLKLRQLPSGQTKCSTVEVHLPKAAQSSVSVAVEPLVPIADLNRYLIKVTPCTDAGYLSFCHRLVGSKIRDRDGKDSQVFEVVAFEILALGLPLPVHTLRPVDGGETQRWLLVNRNYAVIGEPRPGAEVPHLQLLVALNQMQAWTKDEDYPGTLERLQKKLAGEEAEEGAAGTEAEEAVPESTADAMAAAMAQQAFDKVIGLASTYASHEIQEVLVAEKLRYAISSGAPEGDVSGEPSVDPSMRVHMVMIAVSDEIPFELFWPMVRGDIIGAVRELCPRGMLGMEEAVQAGVAQNGMGPIAQRLTLQEAENLATRVGHVVQTAVTVDNQAVQEAQREKAKSQQNETIQLASRIQCSPKGDNTWVPGTVVGQLAERFSMVDDLGVLHENLPRSRVRIPPGRRDSMGSAGAPIQAVLSQADLVRIREHLRRRQEEWAERQAQSSSGGAGGASGGGAGGRGSGADEASGRTPTSSSRPISAPAAAVHRSRASSAPSLDGGGGRGGSVISREGSLSEAEHPGALDVVQFMDDEGMGDDDFDDEEEGPGDDGDDDDEDLPTLEPHDGMDVHGSLPLPRLGASRGSDGDQRDDGEGGGSMEEEMRVMEQLRAMEQIISEVLDPQDGRSRRAGGDSGCSDDFLSAPMANLQIRMGGSDARVETFQIRRGTAPRGPNSEPLRGEFPSFVRTADSTNATSTLDHPVVERLGAADLAPIMEDAEADAVTEAAEEECEPPQLRAFFCIFPKDSEASSTPDAPAGGDEAAPAPTPILLPRSWNLLKAIQYLQDQQLLQNRASTSEEVPTGTGSAPSVQPLQKVPLDNWCLGYRVVYDGDWEAGMGASSDEVAAMQVDAPLSPASRYRGGSEDGITMRRGKLRRRTLATGELSDAMAREMYSGFPDSSDGSPAAVEQLIARCGDSATVTDTIELLRLLHAQGQSLNVESGLWISSKLDRKLRYQLEDSLSVISGTLPLWAVVLPRLCPFLFSLKTRKMLLKYTAFGPSFAVHWTQESKVGSFLKRRATVQTELNAQTDPRKMQDLSQELSNIEEHVVRSNFWLGTLQSTLVRLQKGDEFLRQSDAAMEILSSGSKLMEVQFEGETGFGVAVTQSFYVECAQALQERNTNRAVPMWVEDDDSSGSEHLLSRKGLLLKPLPPGRQLEEAVHRFRFLGRLMGQALREGFIVPLPLAEEFFALLLKEPLGPSSLPRPGSGVAGELLGALADFVADLEAGEAAEREAGRGSPEELKAWQQAQAERMDFAERFLTAQDRPDVSNTQEPMSFEQYVSLVGASFLETGLSGAPLCPDGDNISVTLDNVRSFVSQAAQFWFDHGVQPQMQAFRAGLNDVFPAGCLAAFSRSELREMFCGEDRIEWDEQALLNHMRPTGGLSDKSPTYKFLVATLLELNQAERSRFLDFVTSCPRLPPGGITKLYVDVMPDSGASRQGYPRSRACANQLYLPPYASKEELQEKLHEAMHCSAGHHEQRVRDQ